MTDIPDLEERMAAMQSAFNDAPSEYGQAPPDGDYQALVNRFSFFESQAGAAYLKTEMTVQLDQTYQGWPVDTIHSLEDPDRIGFLKRHLATLGVNVDDLDLREIRPGSSTLEAVLDTPVAVTVKRTTKDGRTYTNVYVNDRLGSPLRQDSDIPADTEGLPEPGAQDDQEKIAF